MSSPPNESRLTQPLNSIDPQAVRVRCATKDGVGYVVAEPANTGVVDGTAELVFTVEDGCPINLVEVTPSSNCRVVRQEVKGRGRTLEVDLGYEMPGESSTTLTYALWYDDAEGGRHQAYGGEPTDTAMRSAGGAESAVGDSTPNPPPEVRFP